MLPYNKKTFTIFALVISAILLYVNYHIFVNRQKGGWMYHEKMCYDQLYPRDIYIKNIYKSNKNTLALDLVSYGEEKTKNDNRWSVTINRSPKMDTTYNCPNTEDPLLLLEEGRHLYMLRNGETKDSISLIISYLPKKSEHTFSYNDVSVFMSSASMSQSEYLPTSYWKYHIENFPSIEIQETRRILKNEIGINDKDNTKLKIEKISAYIAKIMEGRRGMPSNKMIKSSPLQKIDLLKSSSEQVWCGNIADIYLYLSSVAGLTTRKINISGYFGDVLTSGHTFCETFFQEYQKWGYVDAFNNIKFILKANGVPMNTLGVLASLSDGDEASIDDILYTNPSLRKEDLLLVKDFLNSYTNIYYFKGASNWTFYSIQGRVLRYLGVIKISHLYQTGRMCDHNNLKHYLKLLLIILNIFFILASFLALFWKNRKNGVLH
jgi:hypothetical protein